QAQGTVGGVWSKDQMGRVAGGLDALNALNCTTATCESYKFLLVDRALTSYKHLGEITGQWEPVFGVIGGVAGGVAASRTGNRPAGSEPLVGSSQVNKAYEYWASVKSGNAKATGSAGAEVPVV